jgi:hypothetical protein
MRERQRRSFFSISSDEALAPGQSTMVNFLVLIKGYSSPDFPNGDPSERLEVTPVLELFRFDVRVAGPGVSRSATSIPLPVPGGGVGGS